MDTVITSALTHFYHYHILINDSIVVSDVVVSHVVVSHVVVSLIVVGCVFMIDACVPNVRWCYGDEYLPGGFQKTAKVSSNDVFYVYV